MLGLLRLLIVVFTRCFRSHRDLFSENLALPQQLSVLRKRYIDGEGRLQVPQGFTVIVVVVVPVVKSVESVGVKMTDKVCVPAVSTVLAAGV